MRTIINAPSRRERLEETVRYLSVEIGERHLGSAGERQAQEAIEAEFWRLGYETVRETFEAPGWRYGRYAVTVRGEAVDAFPCYFSPPARLKARLATYFPADRERSRVEAFAGCVVFAGNFDFVQVADTNALAERLEKAGAAALIINSPYNDTYSTKIVRSPNLKRMPVFTLSQRSALRLARHEGREVEILLEAERFEHTSCNIIARHRPKRASRGKLVIGAHYDTSPGIPGAADNASGISALLELARSLRPALGDWEVDFIAIGGEEYGGPGCGIGGYAYLQAHRAEAAAIKAMFCLDGLGTYLTTPEARVGRSARLRAITAREGTASRYLVKPFRRGSDQGIFHEHGIPTVWFCDGGADHGVRHFPLHSPQDGIDLIDFHKLENLVGDIERVIGSVLRDGLEEEPFPGIEPCLQEDLPPIVALARSVWEMGADCRRERAYGGPLGAPWQERIAASVRDYLERPDVEAFKLMVDGELAGFSSCRVDGETGLGEIGYNAVDPKFRGRGIGKALLDFVLEELKRRGVRRVEVATGLDPGHAAARSVYEAAGFAPFITSIRYTLELDGLTGLP